MSRILTGGLNRIRAGASSGRSLAIRQASGRPFSPPIDRPAAFVEGPRFWNEPHNLAAAVGDPAGFRVWRGNLDWFRGDQAEQRTWWQQCYRKISVLRRASTDPNLLEFVCEPQSYQIAPGQPFLVFAASDANGSVADAATSFSYNGLAVPLKQKLTVANCYAEATTNNSVVQVRFPSPLPGDASPVPVTLKGYHWNFYLDAAKTPRWQVKTALDRALALVQAGGYFILAGSRKQPIDFDWTNEIANFGAALVQELRAQEFEYVASRIQNPGFAAPDDYNARWLIEADDQANPTDLVAYTAWVEDWLFPTMRSYLRDTTLAFGGGNRNFFTDTENFEPTFPDRNWWLKAAMFNGVGVTNNLTTYAQAQAVASAMVGHARSRKAAGFLLSRFGIDSVAPYDNVNERAAGFGRVLTANHALGGLTVYAAYTNNYGAYNCATRETDNVLRMASGLRARALRAGTYGA